MKLIFYLAKALPLAVRPQYFEIIFICNHFFNQFFNISLSYYFYINKKLEVDFKQDGNNY